MKEFLLPRGRVSQLDLFVVLVVQLVALTVWWSLQSNPLVPTLGGLFDAAGALFHGGLLAQLSTSMQVNGAALALSLVLSTLLAYASTVPVFSGLVRLTAKARYFGLTGFVFLFTLQFGSGLGLRVALLTFCIVPFFVANLLAVVAQIPQGEWDLVAVMGMSRWRSLYEVVVLGRAHDVLDVLRQNASIGWMALTMVEGLTRSEGGLGVMLLDQNRHLNVPAVVVLQVVVLSVGVVQDAALKWVRGVACPYVEDT